MAQPVFDGHPLEEYFQDSGETPEFMPGGIIDLSPSPCRPSPSERMEKICVFVVDTLESLGSFFPSDRNALRKQAFAERFKYGVISSSLLSPALATTPMGEPHGRPSASLPGKLSHSHSRTPSVAESTMTENLSLSMPTEPDTPLWPVTLLFTVAVAALGARFYSLTFFLFAATLYYMHLHRLDVRSKPDVMTPSFLALQHLISAGRLWDTVVNDTFGMLEKEEQSLFSSTPSSSLRVALSTSLLTTQTQCDNVRQLLAAITSPPELAQLAEMYAPPSPIKPMFASDSHRPLSHPGTPPRGTPQTDRLRKRSTWNGSYASLALSPPPSFRLAQRRERRRSDLSALMGASPTPPRTRPRNAPSSPPPLLADVSEEEEEDMMTAESSSLPGDDDEHAFGAAALGLYRKRVSAGLRTFELSQHGMRRTTMSPGSKYTSMHTTRRHHPFSLSSLSQSLQNALASKRFACSHLLALRFEDDEDEVYWEDVRSVMSLLTSTLADASARLSEVLERVEDDHHQLKLETDEDSPPPPPAKTYPLPPLVPPSSSASFAPTPTPLARFAAHVDVISTALDDARTHLAQCVSALQHASSPSPSLPSPPSSHASHPSTSSSSCADDHDHDHPPPEAVQAYNRLRRELGVALRECERGRARLVGLVMMPATPVTDNEDVACLPEPGPVREEKEGASAEEVQVLEHHPSAQAPDLDLDPLPTLESGIERVFEADSEASVKTRPKSRLSREERIRLVKAQRTVVKEERWGPGTEVVQELRDVIYQVGERRRRMASAAHDP